MIRKNSRAGMRTAGRPSARSEAPRGGSIKNVRRTSPSAIPIAPNTTNDQRQPYRYPINPAKAPPAIVPT